LKELNLRYNPGMKNTGLSLIKNSFTNILSNESLKRTSSHENRKYSTDSNGDKNELFTCNIKKLDISSCSFNDSEITGLISKTHVYNLQFINLRFNSHMTKNGWHVINQGIKASSDHIQSLNVLDCALDDAKAEGLLNDLYLKSLNNLNIGDNPSLTGEGWKLFN